MSSWVGKFRACGLVRLPVPGAVVLALILGSAGLAQVGAAQAADSGLVRLRGNTHPLANGANDRGAVAGDFPAERMVLLLQRPAEREAALQAFLAQVGNPGSALYHQYLTPVQYGKRFGSPDADLAAATKWLQGQGFHVARTLSGRTGIEFSGTAGQVEAAFHTGIHSYVVGGEQHYANASDPMVHAALGKLIAGVTLNNFSPRPLHQVMGAATLDPVSHRATPLDNYPNSNYEGCLNGVCYALAPGDFATIYDTKPLLKAGVDGSGVTIAVAGVAEIDTAVVQRFRQSFLPGYSATNLPHVIVDGPDPTEVGSDDLIEAYLDVEEAGSVAPNATVNFYVGGNSYVSDGLALAMQRALDDNAASVLSVSFGACEAYLGTTYNQFYNGLFEQAAGQGMTVLVSTGDTGSAGCDPTYNTSGPTEAVSGLFVSGLASSPYVVAIGGTDFYYPASATATTLGAYWNTPTATSANNNADWSSAKSYIPEKVWNQADPALDQVNLSPSLNAGGGGKSSCITYSGTNVPGMALIRRFAEEGIRSRIGRRDLRAIRCGICRMFRCLPRRDRITALWRSARLTRIVRRGMAGRIV